MNQLKAGVFLNYIVISLNILVGLLYTPFMLRQIGQSEYGIYSLAFSVIAYLTILDLGFGNAIVRYTAKYRAENKLKEQYELFGLFLIVYFVIGIFAFFVGFCLYINVDNIFGTNLTSIELERTKIIMFILIINLVVTFPFSLFGSIIIAYEQFIFPKVVNIVRIVLNTVIMLYLLSMGYKAIAMALVQTVFNFLTLLINFYYCIRVLKIKVLFGKFEWGVFKDIAIYSFWIFLNVIMDKVYWSTGQFVLGAVAGTVAVSIFAVAIQLESMYMHFSTAISSVFLPKITGMIALGTSNKEISDLFIRTGRIQFIVLSFILFGFIVFGHQFICLWAGYEYEKSYYITLIFYIALFVPLIQNLGIIILQARNEMKFRCILYVIIASIAFVLQIIFAKQWGEMGCAIVIGCALFIGQGLVMNVYYMKKQNLDIIQFWKEISRMSIPPFLLSLVTIYILSNFLVIDSWGKLLFGIIIYALIYIPVFYIFSMNEDERKLLLTPLCMCKNRSRMLK